MKITLTVDCPECGEVIEKKIVSLNNDELRVDLNLFEHEEWKCSCGITWISGDLDLFDSDELEKYMR